MRLQFEDSRRFLQYSAACRLVCSSPRCLRCRRSDRLERGWHSNTDVHCNCSRRLSPGSGQIHVSGGLARSRSLVRRPVPGRARNAVNRANEMTAEQTRCQQRRTESSKKHRAGGDHCRRDQWSRRKEPRTRGDRSSGPDPGTSREANLAAWWTDEILSGSGWNPRENNDPSLVSQLLSVKRDADLRVACTSA